jgi:fucose permease
VVLAVYLVTALVNSIPVHTFSTINVAVERIFEISAVEVTLNALLFTIAHPIFAFPCNWLINKHGMRLSFIVGGVFVVGGVWLRLLLEEGNSIFCLMGSGLAAIGNIFILNTPSKLAINWFSSSKVNIVAFTGILFTLLSITLGASLPGFLINDSDSTADDVRELLFYEACIVTVPYIFLIILFKDHPTHPPSKQAKMLVNQ